MYSIFCFVTSYYVIVLKISQVLWGTLLYPILIHPQSEVPISCWSGHLLDCGFHGGDEHLTIHELWTGVKRKVPRYTKVYQGIGDMGFLQLDPQNRGIQH